MPCPLRRWLLLALSVTLPSAADPFASLRASLQRQLVDQHVPSLAVAVAKDGKIIWEEGFGWADRENRVPATAHTLYSLASISKPITATGLMVLVERGLIDLDRPINDYLGEAKLRARAGGPAATVRQVANHSSGLPLHYQFFYEDEPYRPPPMDETIRRYGFLLTPPGERYQYSNLGFGVLDYIISRVSRRPYADYLREEVFVPLGLTHTSVGLGQRLEKYAAVRYGPDGLPIPFYDFDHRGGSAIWASAHDLVRFGLFHLKAHLADQKAILPDPAIDEMHRPTSSQSKGLGYGVGWMIDENLTYRTIYHNGSMGGVATSLFLIPSERIAVGVLCNAGVSLPHRIRQEIISVLLPAQKASPGTEPSPPPSFRPPADLAGTWTGAVHTYKEELPFSLEIFQSGDIHAQFGGQLKTLLNDVTFRDNRLEGRFQGDIGTEDANRRPYYLSLALHLRGNLLNGGVSALSRPGRRAGNALTHWVELNKQ